MTFPPVVADPSLPEHNPFPVLRVSPAGRILYGNPASQSMLRQWGLGIGDLAPWTDPLALAWASGSAQTTEMECGDRFFLLTLVPDLKQSFVDIYAADITHLKGLERERQELLRYERDVQIGRQIQVNFLPEGLFQPEGWEIAAYFSPARDVSGDFYDVFPLIRGGVGLVIADVCDKGVGAAMFMALFRSLIRVFAQQNYASKVFDILSDKRTSAAEVRQRLQLPSTFTTPLENAIIQTNNYISKTHASSSMFATVFLAILDTSSGRLFYINGGHEPPVVLSPTGEIKERLKPTGPAVGLFPDVPFDIGHTQLGPGDLVVAYTDGATDARDPQGKLFGEKPLLGLLHQPGLSAQEMLGFIASHVREHIATAAQFDDITMLAVRSLLMPEDPSGR